jgi:hypothetical protein
MLTSDFTRIDPPAHSDTPSSSSINTIHFNSEPPEYELPTYEPPDYESDDDSIEFDTGIPTDLCYLDVSTLRERERGNIINIEGWNASIEPITPHPIFPSVSNRLYAIPKTHAPRFADHMPVGFDDEEWERVWNSKEVKIDEFLQLRRSMQDGRPIIWTQEDDYKGAPYRLTISNRYTMDLPNFTHGTPISFWNCNGQEYRYFVDHSMHKGHNTHIKLICFDINQRFYGETSTRPPIVLVVPTSKCDVRLHPNLEAPLETITTTRIYTPIENAIIEETLRGMQSRPSYSHSFWKRLFRR